MYPMRNHVLVFVAMLVPALANAQLVSENPQPIEAAGVSDLATGLLLDNTVTVVGHEFFASFALAWRELDGPQRYSVTVSETPTARFGSTIRVLHDGRVVSQLMLAPSNAAARDSAGKLAGDLFQELTTAEAQQALFKDPDLGPQELR